MKRFFPLLPLFILGTNLLSAQKPEIVYSINKEDQPHAFFVKQAELWWKEIERTNKNEKAWYYYYKANRYARMTFADCNTPECRKYSSWLDESKYLKETGEIMKLIAETIPNTYTYYIFFKDGYPNDPERFSALQKAYELEPDNPDTFDELVVYYETTDVPDKRSEFNNKWFMSNDISAGILNYNYNVLMSMQNGGVILTFGDNDTFPIWMLQDALGIRKDITVMNVSLLQLPEYRAKLFKKLSIPGIQIKNTEGSDPVYEQEIIDHILKNKPDGMPLYISTPAWRQFHEYEKNLYLVGLVLEYSEKNLDNIALLKNNFENRFALDYISNQFNYDISGEIVKRINVNYLPGIIKLYQHYKLSGDDEKASKIKELGLIIADKGGDEWRDKAAEILK